MREIIFRGWDGENILPPQDISIPSKHWTWLGKIDCLHEQYTGLVDKNGVMIFEGDIVNLTDHTIEETFESCGALVTMLMTRTYEVFWNVIKWSIKSVELMLAIDPPIFDLPTSNVTYEVIGNIHEEGRE